MSGTGKYTVYAPTATDQHTLLNRLFHSSDPTLRPIAQDLVGKEEDVRIATVDLARLHLQPAHQTGDPGHFPNGVDLDFTYGEDPALAPATDTVKWTRPGDPAFSYAPDVSSPGPGRTAGTDKNVDPKVSSTDIKPNYVAGAPDTGTKSPLATNAKIVAANILGVPGKLGDSGGNV